MKTAKEILSAHFEKGHPTEQPYYDFDAGVIDGAHATGRVLDAMEQYAQQQVKDYRTSLLEQLRAAFIALYGKRIDREHPSDYQQRLIKGDGFLDAIKVINTKT